MTKSERVWYSEALEILRPLRYHITKLIEASMEHDRFAVKIGHPTLPQQVIKDAIRASCAVEDFFTGEHDNYLCGQEGQKP
jgi:hypothetical protein